MAGRKEQVTVQLTVGAVLPLAAYQLDAAFVRLDLLTATEDYRDGFGSPSFGWPGKVRPAGVRNYPGFRLYARSIYDVPDLRDQFADQGMEVYTKAEEIEVVKSLDHAFTLIFRLIAVVAVLGYFASMTSSVLANVNRKSRHLGVIRLIGFSTGSIIWFPIFQALMTAVLGNLTALVLYQVVEKSINRLFGTYLATGEYVCRLTVPPHDLLPALDRGHSHTGFGLCRLSYGLHRAVRGNPRCLRRRHSRKTRVWSTVAILLVSCWPHQ
jgi:putative ABC transport system permease protein